jgi:quinol monooxygenase YgiN
VTIFIEVVFEASTGRRDDFIQLARRTMSASRREAGCVLYRFTADLEHPDRFLLTELWSDEESLKAHFDGKAFKRFFAELTGRGRVVSNIAWQGPLDPYVPPTQPS